MGLPQATYSLVYQAVDRVAARLHSTNPHPDLTFNQIVDLITPQEYRHMLKIMGEIASVNRSYEANNAKLDWPGVDGKLTIKFNDYERKTPFLPRQAFVQPDADLELVASISDWARRTRDIAISCGRVRGLLRWLNEHCTPSQIRYTWPTILSLFTLANAAVPENLQHFKEPKKLPTLPHGVRQACMDAASTVTCSLLVEDVERKERAVVLSITGERVKHPDFGSFEMMI